MFSIVFLFRGSSGLGVELAGTDEHAFALASSSDDQKLTWHGHFCKSGRCLWGEMLQGVSRAERFFLMFRIAGKK